MAKAKRSEEGWDLDGALLALRGAMDPYLWEQGQELYRRDAVEDFTVGADGTIQVKVLDPRDARFFFVSVSRDPRGGSVKAVCRCPYRLGGHCRHQVVALEYLRAVSRGGGEEPGGSPGGSPGAAAAGRSDETAAAEPRRREGPILYRWRDVPDVAARPDGSLLRAVLHEIGSPPRPHRVGLQLYTATGWTELRTPQIERWISRGGWGAHPRDALLARQLAGEGAVRSEVDSDTLAAILSATAGSDALVDRMGSALHVHPWPFRLAARLARGERQGIRVELQCIAADGESRALEEVTVIPSAASWIQLETGEFHPLVAGAPGEVIEELQREDLSEIAGDELERFLADGIGSLEVICRGEVETEPGLIRDVEGVEAARIRLAGTTRTLGGALEFRCGGEWVVAPSSARAWSVETAGEIRRFPPAGQSLARAHRELEEIGFRWVEAEGIWRIEGPQILARILRPRPRAFVELVLPGELEALNLVEREPELSLRVSAWGSGRSAAGGAPAGALAGEAVDGGEAPRAGAGGRTAERIRPIDWFAAEFSLLDGDRELKIDLARLAAARERDPEALITLDDGAVVSLGHESVSKLAELAEQTPAGERAAGRLRLTLASVAELLEEGPAWRAEFDEGVRGLIEALRRDAALPEPDLDEDLRSLLRGYQKEAVAWCRRLGGWGLGGLLADEMGLGKTLMALAHLFGSTSRRGAAPAGAAGSEHGARPPEDGAARSGHREASPEDGAAPQVPVLVVCPASLVFNWLEECRRFFPGVRAVGLQGLPPAEREAAIERGADVIVTSYALLRRDREPLEARLFRAVVLDEGQSIKNPASQTASAAFSLAARERWVLTGTPVENHLGELWSIFHFLLPGFLGELREFEQRFADPIRRGEPEPLARLRSRVHPFILRRTKEQVLGELPPRIEQVERVPLTAGQRRLYRIYLEEARSALEGEAREGRSARAGFKVLAALTRLRQICCHPALVLEREGAGTRSDAEGGTGVDDEGGKFELLLELLDECVEEGHRVLLFSQFTSMLDLIEEGLRGREMRWCRLDGSTRDREAVVRRFQHDASIPLFLISLKAGGLGLNLTQADTVVIYDPWWNPAVEEQAAARAHRLGQSVPVHVHRLITTGTLEEKILELQGAKRELARSVIEAGEDPLASLSLADVEALLGE